MSSARIGNKSYAGPTMQEGMAWVDDLTRGRGGRARVLMESYIDKQERRYVCVAVQYWKRQVGDRYEVWASEELRCYGDNHVRIGSILMKLAMRLEHKLTAREEGYETQAHF